MDATIKQLTICCDLTNGTYTYFWIICRRCMCCILILLTSKNLMTYVAGRYLLVSVLLEDVTVLQHWRRHLARSVSGTSVGGEQYTCYIVLLYITCDRFCINFAINAVIWYCLKHACIRYDRCTYFLVICQSTS